MFKILCYPITMCFCLILYFFLSNVQDNILLSTYLPVILGAVLITYFERRAPYRASWAPDKNSVKNDLMFMAIIQIALPKILSFLSVIFIHNKLTSYDTELHSLWPHQWSTITQVLLMILIADFFRYWLHRAAHTYRPLWRLHAVHHSPKLLYWFNVGRFHPIDKTLQFFCDALPFILLNVKQEVLGLYFVFYAINGFFQHCNIDLKLGFLNYIISGPELHHWHHSIKVRESNRNYGNNIIIWDLVFGTWFLPKETSVDTLGLKNREYPKSFFSQLITPFIKGLDQKAK